MNGRAPDVAGGIESGEIQRISDWILAKALGEVRIGPLFTGLCRRLVVAGVPLLRGHLAVRALHPMFRSMTVTWRRDGAVEIERLPHAADLSIAWQQSPLNAMIEERRFEMRFRLEQGLGLERFPVLAEFRSAGATDYLAMLTPFGDPQVAHLRQDGMICSWLADRPGGFDDGHIAVLRRLQPRLGVAVKVAKREETAINVVAAYLGADAGMRVLAGQIQRGDGSFIRAVLWYSDLRDSTALVERLPSPAFLALLDRYFECTAGAVLEHGGEVLRFIGDAVLAVFPIGEPSAAVQAARAAFAAASEAERRLAAVNAERSARGEPPLGCGLALHIGDVLYGNIGVPERLEFSVIGRAANEVARIEGLTKTLGVPLLVSAEYAAHVPLAWRSLGRHSLRGASAPMQVFAPDGHPVRSEATAGGVEG